MFGPSWARRVWAVAIAGGVAFVVCSFVPMWNAIWVGAWCGTGSNGSLWRMLLAMTDPEMEVEWQFGAVVTSVMVHIAAVAAALMSGGRRGRSRSNGSEGP